MSLVRTSLLLFALGCGGQTANVDAGVDAPMCTDNGTCITDDECCLGPCDKDADVCLGDCQPDFATCYSDSVCCNLVCNANGICGQ